MGCQLSSVTKLGIERLASLVDNVVAKELTQFVPVPADKRVPSYFDLYGQSSLRDAHIKLEHLDGLAKAFLTRPSPIAGTPFLAVKPRDEFKELYNLVTDICEKLGFLRLAIDAVQRIQSKHEVIDGAEWYYLECEEVKYHVYNCIFNAKAVSDSVSFLLKNTFGLSYERGEIDFIKEKRFRGEVILIDSKFGEIWKNHGGWFKNLVRFRDGLIHRQFIPVYVPDSEYKVVFDFRPVGTEIVDGQETIHFDLAGGCDGKFPARKFKFKRTDVAIPWKPSYVMPNDIVSYVELSSKSKLKFDDYQKVLDFCNFAFDRLKELSEVAFRVTLEKTTKKSA